MLTFGLGNALIVKDNNYILVIWIKKIKTKIGTILSIQTHDHSFPYPIPDIEIKIMPIFGQSK